MAWINCHIYFYWSITLLDEIRGEFRHASIILFSPLLNSPFIFWLCPKLTGMKYSSKVRGNVFALVQIFSAIPAALLGGDELRTITPNSPPLSSVPVPAPNWYH